MSSPVARLRTISPATPGPFVVRGVVPCPAVFPDGQEPPDDQALVVSLGGVPFPTQVEPCRFDQRGRAEALEVSAYVDAPLYTGTTLALELEYGPALRAVAPAPGSTAEAIRSGTLSIHVGLLDAAGYRWSYVATCDPSADPHRVHRAGPIVETLEFCGRLRSTEAGAPFGGELLGWTLWLTWRAGEDVVEAILSLDSGRVAPALPHLDLRGVELQVPAGIELEHKGPEIASRPPLDLGERWSHPLQDSETTETWRQRAERVWRFALFGSGLRPRARALLDNVGFAVPDPSPGLWSWANPSLCGWLAQGARVPSLAHLGVGPVGVPGSSSSLQKILDRLRSGATLWDGGGSPRMGLWHPWGVAYGGMTGGTEIDQLLGVELAAGAPDARRLLEYQLRGKALLDRQPVALYGDNGRPIPLDDHTRADGSLPFAVFNGGLGKADPFGFASALASWTRPTTRAGYDAELLAFAPMDEQHLVRFTGPWKVLAALDRDPLAIRLLSLEAELVRGHLWEGTGGMLAGALQKAEHRSRFGAKVGRGEGWDLDVVANAWIYRHAPWRRRFRRWAAAFLRLVAIAPTPAGVWQRNDGGKLVQGSPYNGHDAAAQSIEHGIFANGAIGLWRAAGIADPTAHVDRAIREAASTGVRYFWPAGQANAWATFAVAPIDWLQPPYGTLPAGLHSTTQDSAQLWNLLGYGLELAHAAGDQAQVATIREIVRDLSKNAGSPVAWLQNQGWSNLHNRAALLAALQAGL